jgi:hypothetical protein
MHPQQEFLRERRIALNTSIGDHPSFEKVLKKHALVSVDVALPKQTKSYYIRQGQRLANVQTAWIDTLYAAMPLSKHTHDTDNEYRTIVAEAICNSTDTLMDSLVDGTHVNWQHVGEPLEIAHRHLSSRSEQVVHKTRAHWQNYIGELQKMYQCTNEDSYYMAARRVLASANLLGTWLDEVVFVKPHKMRFPLNFQ